VIRSWKHAQSLQLATLDEGAVIGRLDDFQFDLETRRIYGWRVRGSGVFAKTGGVRSADLVLIGQDLAFVRAGDCVEWSGGTTDPAPGRAWASTYKGTRVIVRRGSDLGSVQDYLLNRAGGAVTGIVLGAEGVVTFDERVRVGSGSVILRDAQQVTPLHEEKARWWERLMAGRS